MKLHLHLIFLGFLVSGITRGAAPHDSASLGRAVNGALSPLKSLLETDPSGQSAMKHLRSVRLVQNDFVPYFYQDQGGFYYAKPERMARVRGVEDCLSNFEPQLLLLLRKSTNLRDGGQTIHTLLEFSAATPELNTALREMAGLYTEHPVSAGRALETLFKQQLDDPELRRTVVEMIGWRDEPSNRAEIGRIIRNPAAMEWAMAEVEPLLVKAISTPYKPLSPPEAGGNQFLYSDYQWASEGFKRRGLLSVEDAPLLAARLKEISESPDAPEMSNVIASLKQSLDTLEGRERPTGCLNWKGQRLGVSKEAELAWRAHNGLSMDLSVDPLPPPAAIPAPGPPNSSATPKTSPPEAPIPASTFTKSPTQPFGWLLVVGCAVILAAVYLLRAARKRRR